MAELSSVCRDIPEEDEGVDQHAELHFAHVV